MRSCGMMVGVVGALAISACGSGARQDVAEPHKKFPVEISHASFPASQSL
jgi:hypothetical protein